MGEGDDQNQDSTEVLGLRLGFLEVTLVDRLNRQDEKLDTLLKHIEGNGGPGLRMVVDRLNQRADRVKWWAGSIAGSAVGAVMWIFRSQIFS